MTDYATDPGLETCDYRDDGYDPDFRCGLSRLAHAGRCPHCGGTTVRETEAGPAGCQGCASGLGPHGHDFVRRGDR